MAFQTSLLLSCPPSPSFYIYLPSKPRWKCSVQICSSGEVAGLNPAICVLCPVMEVWQCLAWWACDGDGCSDYYINWINLICQTVIYSDQYASFYLYVFMSIPLCVCLCAQCFVCNILSHIAEVSDVLILPSLLDLVYWCLVKYSINIFYNWYINIFYNFYVSVIKYMPYKIQVWVGLPFNFI